MLSRVANSIFWMSRYVERAENLARFIDVTLNVILDHTNGGSEHWEPLVRTTGDEEYFAKHYGQITSENVRRFLTFDRDYSSSIIASIRFARENARTVREAISSESWEQLNAFYHFVKDAAAHGEQAATSEFYNEVKQHCHLFNGILDATMTRGKGWHFANLGRHLERADKTSRILDVKYFTLLHSVQDVGTTFDDLLWSAVLRSVSGFEMYRKRYHGITIRRVVEFLVLERDFPRAIRHCLHDAEESLRALGGPVPLAENSAHRALTALIARLAETSVDTIIDGGMHEFIDDLQGELNGIGSAIRETYFAQRPLAAAKSGAFQSQR